MKNGKYKKYISKCKKYLVLYFKFKTLRLIFNEVYDAFF